jgi:DNA-binding transcriptional ArsR family regulator
VVLARVARNRRLADACYQWAFCSLKCSPGARDFYDLRRARGSTHHQALRALANLGRNPPWMPRSPHPLRRRRCLELGPINRRKVRRLTRYSRGMSRSSVCRHLRVFRA